MLTLANSLYFSFMGREFKYQAYLDKYKNCPMDDCIESDGIAYRWTHNPPVQGDFKPILADPANAHRIIDNDDKMNYKMCTGYALSLYKDAKSAITVYNKTFDGFDRPIKRTRFKERIGTASAKVHITKNDGIFDEHKEDGHFNFFEYKDCNLFLTISEILDNFA